MDSHWQKLLILKDKLVQYETKLAGKMKRYRGVVHEMVYQRCGIMR